MAESTLTAAYSQIRQEVGDYLGYGRTVADWSTTQAADIEQAIVRGYRQFLSPAVEPFHEWSFLRPTATITTVADDYDYDLPADFGNIGNGLTFEEGDPYGPILIVNINFINRKRESVSSSGKPEYAAIQPKADSSAGQRWELILHPTPDAVYVLTYQYHAITNALSSSNPYPLGGQLHSETVLQSCLAMAELRTGKGENIQLALFMQRLQASISLDKRNAPKYIGKLKNGQPRRRWVDIGVTYVGRL